MYEPLCDKAASGRLGPEEVALDRASAQGDFSMTDLRLESLSNFSSVRANAAVFKVPPLPPAPLPPLGCLGCPDIPLTQKKHSPHL